ncbi:MAG: hypothetical protein B7Z20_08405 [Sphingobium sp. 32-64-5]|nr:MAG: hypothetical protein B7Z20_08405 [Sphingobium sp. 32-64-5]
MAINAKDSSFIRRETTANDTQSRLIRTLCKLWGEHSQAEISVRMVAREAEASVSAIDYHFGSLEQLFAHAQNVALQRASDWMDGVFNELRDYPLADLPLTARASLLAALIEQWTGEQRPLALAWREAHAAALAQPDHFGPHLEWTALWRRFWTRLCSECRFGDNPELLWLFFDGEASQHLIRWHSLLDRALLDETALALLQFAYAPCRPSSAVRIGYQDLAERDYRLVFGAKEEFTPIDDAAAALLSESGLASLTFRSVAHRARTTLGAVSYHFGSKSKMLRLALQRIYEGNSGKPTLEQIDAMPSDPREAKQSVIHSVIGGTNPLLRALDEIILNLSRGESDKALGGVIRGFRDPVGEGVLRKLLGTAELVSPALVAVLSSVIRGFGHCSAGMAREDAVALGDKAFGVFVIEERNPA